MKFVLASIVMLFCLLCCHARLESKKSIPSDEFLDNYLKILYAEYYRTQNAHPGHAITMKNVLSEYSISYDDLWYNDISFSEKFDNGIAVQVVKYRSPHGQLREVEIIQLCKFPEK